MKSTLYKFFKKFFSSEILEEYERISQEKVQQLQKDNFKVSKGLDSILKPIKMFDDFTSMAKFLEKEFKNGRVFIFFNDEKKIRKLMGMSECVNYNLVRTIRTKHGDIDLYYIHDRERKGIRIMNNKIKLEYIFGKAYALTQKGFKGFIIK